MRSVLTKVLTVLVVLGWAAAAQAVIDPAVFKSTNWAEAEKVMKEKTVPTVVYFHSPRVQPCRDMEDRTFSDPAVRQRLARVQAVALAEDANRDLARQWKLIKVPTVIFFDAWGRELDRAVGFKNAEDLAKYLDRYLAATADRKEGSASPTPFTQSAIDISIPEAGRERRVLRYEDSIAKTVHLVGDFNDWRTDATPMQRGSDGVWMKTAYLPEGVYEYLFLVDGAAYKPDMENPYKRGNPYDGVNSVLVIGKQAPVSPRVNGRTVDFIVQNEKASKVEIAGSFTNWRMHELKRKKGDDGTWGVRYTLPPGTYTYKLVVDGKWMMDPENLTPERDGKGWNSAFKVE